MIWVADDSENHYWWSLYFYYFQYILFTLFFVCLPFNVPGLFQPISLCPYRSWAAPSIAVQPFSISRPIHTKMKVEVVCIGGWPEGHKTLLKDRKAHEAQRNCFFFPWGVLPLSLDQLLPCAAVWLLCILLYRVHFKFFFSLVLSFPPAFMSHFCFVLLLTLSPDLCALLLSSLLSPLCPF